MLGSAITVAVGASSAGCAVIGESGGALPKHNPTFDALASSLDQTARAAFGLITASPDDDQNPAYVADLMSTVAGIADIGTARLWHRGSAPEPNRLRCLLALVEAPGEQHSGLTVLHDHGQVSPLRLPAIFQLAVNLLILHSSGAQNEDETFDTTGLDARRLEDLQKHYLIDSIQPFDEQHDISQPVTYQAITTRADTIVVEWSPSPDDRTQRGLLAAHKGVLTPAGPDWRVEGFFALPYGRVFD